MNTSRGSCYAAVCPPSALSALVNTFKWKVGVSGLETQIRKTAAGLNQDAARRCDPTLHGGTRTRTPTDSKDWVGRAVQGMWICWMWILNLIDVHNTQQQRHSHYRSSCSLNHMQGVNLTPPTHHKTQAHEAGCCSGVRTTQEAELSRGRLLSTPRDVRKRRNRTARPAGQCLFTLRN